MGEYGYKKIEIAGYLRKDPAAVTLYLRDGQEKGKEVETVIALLKEKKENS